MVRLTDEFVNMKAASVFQKHALPWIILAALCAGCATAHAQESEKTARLPVLFQKIYVPQDRIAELKGKYIPVRREEFDQKIKTIRSREIARDAPLDARIVRASYYARLVNDELVDGTAELTIIHSEGKPAVVPMAPCGLAIEEPSWEAGGAEAPSEETADAPAAARVGLDDTGRTIALVEASGVLRFNWSLRGRRETPGDLAFKLQFPASPVNHLNLDIPVGLEPTVQRGIVSQDSDGAGDEAYRRWSIELGGNNSTDLRIIPSGGEQEAQRLVFLRQQMTYRISPTGVGVLVDLHLDVRNEPLSQLTLVLEESLQLLSGSCADARLTWTESLSDKGRKVVLELPEAILGIDRTIQLRAVAPIAMAESWKLPSLSVEGTIWLEGGATLEVPRPLYLEHLAVTGGRQTKLTQMPSPNQGESIQIQYFKSDAVGHAIICPHEGEILVHQGTTIKAGPARVNAICVADFVSTGSPRFVLEIETSNNWTIDLIETEPPDLIEDWSMKTGRLIQVRLREALAPDRPLRVIVHGHGRGVRRGVWPGGRDMRSAWLDGQNLRFCVFRGVKIARSLVAVGADSPFQLQLAGDAELIRLGSSELTEQESELLTWQAGGVAYVDGPAADNLIIAFSSDPPKYAANVQILADVAGAEITQAYEVVCVPESSSIDKVLVHFSEPSEQDLRWLLNDGDTALAARRLTLEQQQQVGTHGGETWEVDLPTQQDSSFKLTARRTEPFNGQSPIPLVSLPGATAQVGSVTIRSPETVPIAIQQTDLQPIPPKPPSAGEYPTIRGVYRYEPSQLSRISVSRQTKDAQPHQAWIWLCQLVSRFSDDGQATHEAVYRIENAGAAQLELKPPRYCELLQASVDDREAPLPADVSADSNLVIPLPRGVRFPTVVIRFTARAEPLRSVCRVSAPWPHTNLSVFRREWVVWLPPGFHPLRHDTDQGNVGWSHRLLGPLLRSNDRGPFNPFSEHHWRSLGTDVEPQETRLLSQAETFLRDLARQLNTLQEANDEESHVTWGELLADCELARRQRGGTPLPIWIDQHGLAQAGITPHTPVDDAPAATRTSDAAQMPVDQGLARGADLLQRTRLAVISHNGGLLLTTADAPKEHDWPVSAGPHRSIATAIGPDASARLLPSGSDLRIVPVLAWTAHPPLPQQCWSVALRRSIGGVADDGWSVRVLPIEANRLERENGNEITRLRIHQPQAVGALAWAAFLATAGLVWWVIRRRILLGIPLATVAGIAALFAPDGWLPVFSSSFLGVVLAGCFAMVFPRGKRRARRKLEAESESKMSSVLLETAGLGFIAVVAWMNITGASAQETAAPKPADFPKVQFVLFPVDENREPSGHYVYVPPALASVLHREGSAGGMAQQKWMICAADYRATLQRDVAMDELVATELVAKYDVEVSERKTRIVLPVEQQQVYLLPNRARWNGQPASVSWMPEGKGLSVEVSEPGKCRLELAFRPRIDRTGDKAGFQLGIPPVPRSQLKVELPDQVKGIEFPTVLGTVLDDDQTGLKVVQLGPTSQLSVRWPVDPNAKTLPSALSVDQLMWLRVRPGSVVLDAKLKFTTLSGTIDRVRLLADPRLTILPPGPNQPIAGSHVSTDGGIQTIWLDIKPPFGREVAFDVSFVLTGAWGVGNVRVPRLEAIADRTSRRWLAISVAEGLEFKSPKRAGNESPSEAEFSAAWGQEEAAPQVVAQVPDGPPDWMLSTWPREPVVTAAQRLAVSVGRNKADIQLDADIEIVNGNRFQYRIVAPKLVRVTNVSVVENDTERVARWYHDDREGVIVRLDAPVTQSHHLQLQGEIPVRPNSTNFRLPRITLADVTRTEDRVDLYRLPQVQVDLANKAGFVDVAGAALGARREGWGRLVAALQSSNGASKAATIQAKLRPNRPRTTARLVITLDRQDGAWSAQADCDFRAANGILDAIRLEVPPEWNEPFDVEPETEFEIVEVPDQNRRQIVIRPTEAVERNFHVRVRGALSASTGERIRAPDIVPLDVTNADRYLVVPSKLQRQQIAWETSGLQEAPLPRGYQSELESYVSYVLGDRFQATIKDVQPEPSMASVQLVDVHVDCSDEGDIVGVATFDVEPAGLSDCIMELPVGYRLVHVTVGNLPAQLGQVDRERWRIRFGPHRLPQQIQVIFTGTLQPAHWRQRTAIVQSPRLVGIPVEQTLWTLQGPGAADIRFVPNEPCLDPLSHELLRLDKTTALVRAATDVVADSDSADILHWYLPWARRLIASEGRAARWRAAQPSGADQTAALAASVAKREEITTRLGVGEIEARAVLECSQVTEPADVWRTALSRPVTTRRCAFAETRETIEFRCSAERPTTNAERWAAVAILLGIAVVCLVLLPSPSLEYGLRRCPQLLGIPLGVVWWLWFAPSLLGLIILLLAGLSSVRPLLRAAKSR